MSDPDPCRFIAAAYPGQECFDHRHEARVFDLSRTLAAATHKTADPTDEQAAWFLADADAVVDDFDPTPPEWVVTAAEISNEPGLDFTLTINGRAYVVQDNGGSGEVCNPVARDVWESWHAEDEA